MPQTLLLAWSDLFLSFWFGVIVFSGFKQIEHLFDTWNIHLMYIFFWVPILVHILFCCELKKKFGRHSPRDADSRPGWPILTFSFFPKSRPMEDLMLFFLLALWRESWLLFELLPSAERLERDKQSENQKVCSKRVREQWGRWYSELWRGCEKIHFSLNSFWH